MEIILYIIQIVAVITLMLWVGLKFNKIEEKEKRLDDMFKKTLLKQCNEEKNYITIDDARKRDYIVRTKYYGKIVDPAIKKDFKSEIENTFRNNFEGVCNNILNYHFKLEDGVHFCKDVLGTYYKILEQFECKQFILDVYGDNK